MVVHFLGIYKQILEIVFYFICKNVEFGFPSHTVFFCCLVILMNDLILMTCSNLGCEWAA